MWRMELYWSCILVFLVCCSQTAFGSGSVIICEGSSMYLTCPPGQVLHVASGIYGRHQGSIICPHVFIRTTNCYSPRSTTRVQSWCNGHNMCLLKANNFEFGDPCPWTYKYLQVNYACS